VPTKGKQSALKRPFGVRCGFASAIQRPSFRDRLALLRTYPYFAAGNNTASNVENNRV
jgi:hypothetical protein